MTIITPLAGVYFTVFYTLILMLFGAVLFSLSYLTGRSLAERKYIRTLTQKGSYQTPGAFLSLLK